MLLKFVLALVLLSFPSLAQATTYYISPTGSDAAAGTSTGTAWQTWSKALGASSACGDTILVMDGTFTTATHGNPSLTKVCTVGNEFTVRALNQRVALISGDGTAHSFRVINSAYVVLDGLRIKSVDNATTNSEAVVAIRTSSHVTIKNSLIYTNNRYGNTHLLGLFTSTNGLVEDLELYDFHRHGIIISSGSFNVIRRMYCHSRNRADIVGGFASASPTRGEGCTAVYPSNDNILENIIAENSLEIAEVNSSGTNQGRRNQILGSVIIGSSTYPSGRGIIFDARANSTSGQPQDNTVRDSVAILQTGNGNHGINARGALNTQVWNSTVIGAEFAGFAADEGPFTGGGTNSYFCTNCLSLNNGTQGFIVEPAPATDNWTINYPNSFGNGTAFSPAASDPNITNEQTIDPVLGSCYLWLPDASPLKGAGLAGADIGATILYRYVDGVLTTTKLWDDVTGEFPHGAIIAGVNDIAGQSLFDVHERLHVGTANGCAFPAGYAGSPPANPAGLVSSQGTTNPSHDRTVTASKEALVAGIALNDTSGNVGTVTGVTSSCGAEALTQVGTAVTSPAYRRVYLFRRLNPTAGSCTISVVTSGTVMASVLTTNEYDNVAAFGTAVTATGLSGTPSVTASVVADAGNIILDMYAGKCGLSAGVCTTSLSAGPNQVLQGDQGHFTLGDVRLATSEKVSTNGTNISYATLNSYWAIVAVPMCAVSCDALTHVVTQSQSQVDGAFLVGGAVVHLGAVNAANVNIPIGTSFAVTLQTDCTVAASPTGGRRVWVSHDSGAYAPLTDTLTNGIVFHGATGDPLLVSGAVAACLDAGALTEVAGTTIQSAATTPSVTLTQDDCTANRWVATLGQAASGTYEFREYTDAGVPLDAYGATADAKITVTGTQPDIQAPTNLKLTGSASTDVTLSWSPNAHVNFAGYRVYQSTESGVYDVVPTYATTPSIAALLNTPVTTWSTQLSLADTYYFVVTAFDHDNNESAVSNEVSVALTGMPTRTVSTTRTAATARTPR